jgi:hypothetical protein
MAQLVGQKCSLCGKAIGSVLDGAFCPACKLPYHHKCRIPEIENADPNTCRSCGSKVQKKKTVPDSSKPKPVQQSVLRQVFTVARAMRWIIGGICIIGIGILLLIDPDLRTDPRRLAVADIAYAFVPILVGVVLFFLAYWSVRRRK